MSFPKLEPKHPAKPPSPVAEEKPVAAVPHEAPAAAQRSSPTPPPPSPSSFSMLAVPATDPTAAPGGGANATSGRSGLLAELLSRQKPASQPALPTTAKPTPAVASASSSSPSMAAASPLARGTSNAQPSAIESLATDQPAYPKLLASWQGGWQAKAGAFKKDYETKRSQLTEAKLAGLDEKAFAEKQSELERARKKIEMAENGARMSQAIGEGADLRLREKRPKWAERRRVMGWTPPDAQAGSDPHYMMYVEHASPEHKDALFLHDLVKNPQITAPGTGAEHDDLLKYAQAQGLTRLSSSRQRGTREDLHQARVHARRERRRRQTGDVPLRGCSKEAVTAWAPRRPATAPTRAYRLGLSIGARKPSLPLSVAMRFSP